MGDFCEDSEDGRSSVGDEERVRRIFQACDINCDGYIDSNDLLNVCRELGLEESLEDLLRELGADDQGRICYEEFLRRRVALRKEIDAVKLGGTNSHSNSSATNANHTTNSSQSQPDYLPTSSENSLGEGKMSWEFDSGARDLSPEPHHGLQQTHPASGNLLELANKLHVAAVASLKSEIEELSRHLRNERDARAEAEQAARKERDERRRLEKHVSELTERHEEHLTELHSVIAELTRKVHMQRSMVIQEEDPSEAEDQDGGGSGGSAVVECSQALLLDDDNDDDEEGDIVDENNDEDAQSIEDDSCARDEGNDKILADELAKCRAENAMLTERLTRALQDLETISALHSKKKMEPVEPVDIVRTARVANPNALLDRTTPSLVVSMAKSVPESIRTPSPSDLKKSEKVTDRVRLKRSSDSDNSNSSGIRHRTTYTDFDECDMRENTDDLSKLDRLIAKLENVRAQNAVLAITLEQCKAQCDRLSLLVGKYESNAIALQIALNCSDEALQIAEVLILLLESELSVALANCLSTLDEDHRISRRTASENRKKAEDSARALLERSGPPNASSSNLSTEARLRERLRYLKQERETCRSTVVQLDTPHVQPQPRISNAKLSSSDKRIDLEMAVLMQELMSIREERAELKSRVQQLERRERCSLSGGDEAPGQVLQSEGAELRNHASLVLDLRTANTALVATLDRCKRKYQHRLRKLEMQMAQLVNGHQTQIKTLKQRIAVLEETSQLNARLEETNI